MDSIAASKVIVSIFEIFCQTSNVFPKNDEHVIIDWFPIGWLSIQRFGTKMAKVGFCSPCNAQQCISMREDQIENDLSCDASEQAACSSLESIVFDFEYFVRSIEPFPIQAGGLVLFGSLLFAKLRFELTQFISKQFFF